MYISYSSNNPANKYISLLNTQTTDDCEMHRLMTNAHTSSRLFCHRPQGLSSRTPLSSSDSSPLSGGIFGGLTGKTVDFSGSGSDIL